MSRSTVIPTHRWISHRKAGLLFNAIVLVSILGAYVLAADRKAPGADSLAQHEAARQAGYAEALDTMGQAVVDAYAIGYRTGVAASCKPKQPL